MTGWLDGQVSLVLGGGSGIGAAVAGAFVAEGAMVTVFDRRESVLSVAEALGAQATAVIGDATTAADCRRAVRACEAAYGTIDTLVSCIGVFDFYASLESLDETRMDAAFDELFRTNVKGTLVGVREALVSLRRSRGSVTLTVSSSAYKASGGGILYGSSKWAVRGLVLHLARELAPEVRVNGVAPGGTGATQLAGLRSLGQDQTADTVAGRDDRIRADTALDVLPTPEDHAAAYVYLASRRKARVVTGAIVNSDGGSTL